MIYSRAKVTDLSLDLLAEVRAGQPTTGPYKTTEPALPLFLDLSEEISMLYDYIAQRPGVFRLRL